MTPADLQARIAATQALITAYEEAALSLASGAIQSYTLDTGQSRQTVTKFDLDKLEAVLDTLYNRCAMLEARLNGSNVSVGRAGW